jgi:alkanesulfonate monooxygenase SsuD/methylene tetrahydromethanopterin reductase-like flavin-dependent oxidoreductase (luciferase family)
VKLGVAFGSGVRPEEVPRIARLAEGCGFDQVWVTEDYFGFAAPTIAGAALGATESATVGIGVVSAMVRHPAVLAMELATLARVYPARLVAGIGSGTAAWIRQMGLAPRSGLAAMRECTEIVRALVGGLEATTNGLVFRSERIRLEYPPPAPLPLYMGVVGRRGLRLSATIADGTILSVLSSPGYVRWARSEIEAGRTDAGRPDHHPVVVYVLWSMDRDPLQARWVGRRLAAFYLAAGGRSPLTDAAGISDELDAMIASGGAEYVEHHMPDDWLDDFTISGDPAHCAARVERYVQEGADRVVLMPMAGDQAEDMLRLAAEEMLPRLSAPA